MNESTNEVLKEAPLLNQNGYIWYSLLVQRSILRKYPFKGLFLWYGIGNVVELTLTQKSEFMLITFNCLLTLTVVSMLILHQK